MPPENQLWKFTTHACRNCLGTILQSESTFICAICWAETNGEVSKICGCGLKPRDNPSGKLLAFKCAPIENPGPANPAHVGIRFAEEVGS